MDPSEPDFWEERRIGEYGREKLAYARAQLRKVEEVIAKFTFKGLLKAMDMQFLEPVSTDGYSILIKLAVRVPHVDTDEIGSVYSYSHIDLVVCDNPEYLKHLLLSQVWQAVRHEMDEGLWYEGGFANHPHPEERT